MQERTSMLCNMLYSGIIFLQQALRLARHALYPIRRGENAPGCPRQRGHSRAGVRQFRTRLLQLSQAFTSGNIRLTRYVVQDRDRLMHQPARAMLTVIAHLVNALLEITHFTPLSLCGGMNWPGILPFRSSDLNHILTTLSSLIL